MSREADAVATRSRGDRTLLGTALLVAGTLWLLGELGLFHVAGRLLASAALVCIGAGLLITRRTGRRRWPILIGGILALSLLGNSASANFRSRFGSDFGSRSVVPMRPADVHSSYRTGFGSLTLDLRHVHFADGAHRRIAVNVGLGALRITVPAGIGLQVTVSDSAGAVRVLGNNLGGGVGVRRTFTNDAWGVGTAPQVSLDLTVEAGAIDVDQAGGPGSSAGGGPVSKVGQVPGVGKVPAVPPLPKVAQVPHVGKGST